MNEHGGWSRHGICVVCGSDDGAGKCDQTEALRRMVDFHTELTELKMAMKEAGEECGVNYAEYQSEWPHVMSTRLTAVRGRLMYAQSEGFTRAKRQLLDMLGQTAKTPQERVFITRLKEQVEGVTESSSVN